MQLRAATRADDRAVEELTRRAFWNLYQPGADEHYLTHVLRGRHDHVPELCLVAEDAGQVVGSIVFTRSHVVAADGHRTPILTFAPLCVAPERRGKGIGGALITAARDKAAALGERAICILGYPMYYQRFGFVNAQAFGVSMPDGSQPWALQILELRAGALAGVHGHIELSAAFDLDPAEVAAFDKQFVAAAKFTTPSQRAFKLAQRLSYGDPVPLEVHRDANLVVRDVHGPG